MQNFMYKKRTYKCGTGNAEKKFRIQMRERIQEIKDRPERNKFVIQSLDCVFVFSFY